MDIKAKGITLTAVILLAVTALFSGIYVGHYVHSPKKIDISRFHGTYLEHPRAINQFSLIGADGKPYTNANLQGQWTLMFFGFTNCGYLCPTTLAELGKMYRILENQHIKQLPQVVMISIDPERDNQDKLANYVTSFHSHFYGARGEEDAIKKMTHEMGIAYAKILENKGDSNANNYDIQHRGAVILFNPQGELNAFFTTPHHADVLAKDYILLVS